MEKQKFFESYDVVPNYTKLEGKYTFYFIKVPNSFKEEIIKELTKSPHVTNLALLIGEYNIGLAVLEKKDINFRTYFKKKNIPFIDGPIKKIKMFNFNIYNSVKKNQTNHLDKNFHKKIKLDKIDYKLIKHLGHGGGRDSLLEVSQKLNLTYDIVSYRFKRLRDNGYFLGYIGQPSRKMLNLHIDAIILKTQNISFDECHNLLKNNPNLSSLSQFDENTFFTQILATSIENYKETLEFIHEKLESHLIETKIFHIKTWLFTNRFNFESKNL